MADQQKDQQSGESEPLQFYRFVVRTADGREMTSAVAVVDPNSKAENQSDPKDSMEEDQKHKQEEKQHGDDLADAHDAEAE